MTPNELEILIHFYVCREPYPREHAPAVIEAINQLIKNDVIILANREISDGVANRTYKTTEKGEAWLKTILATPMPKCAWIDAQGNEIK